MSEITKHQQQGVSLRAFSEQTGIREGQLRHYCIKGQIIGARKHSLTKKWWIYPPAKLVLSDGGAYKPRRKASEMADGASGRRRGSAVLAAVAAAFDLGTSPHGLSAGLPPSVQETPEAAAPPLSAKPPLTLNVSTAPGMDEGCAAAVSPGVLPSVFAAPEVQETMRSIKKAAGEAHYPVVLSGSQMKLMEQAISDAIDGAIDAMSNEPGGRHEIKPYLDACNQLYRILKAAKAAHKTANEDWRGVEL